MGDQVDFEKKVEQLDKRIEIIKYHFVDMQGNLREKSRSRDEIKKEGTTSTDGSSIFGKIIPPTESDLLLIPDPETLVEIPWKENAARVICNVFHPPEKEGEAPKLFEGCPRSILAAVENEIGPAVKIRIKSKDAKTAAKYHAFFAPELEFVLVDKDYDFLKIHKDQSLENNHYFVPPNERIDKALTLIMRYLTLMGVKKEMYHTEVTTYQYEIGIQHGDALAMADAIITLKYIVEQVSQEYGLKASFIPKFRKSVNGSGMHVHQNLAITIDGKTENLFFDPKQEDGLSDIGKHYIAGLLKYAKEITAITNPLPISYKRLVPGAEAPTYIVWDWKNRTALCRGHSEGTKKVRVEYRSPDPMCNPYLAFSAMIAAGLEGIEQGLDLAKADKRNFYYDHLNVEELPGNLGEALDYMAKSTMLKKRLGEFIISTLYKLGKDSWRDYNQEVTDVDIKMFF